MERGILDIIYIADIDQDIDDIIAVNYLVNVKALRGVVIDPMPTSKLGIERLKKLRARVQVFEEVPKCDYIFNGGAMTKLARYLQKYDAKMIVLQGGYVGGRMADEVLPKFRGKLEVRTYNFNLDVEATEFVLENTYGEVVIIGKNVCHSEKNTTAGIWKGFPLIQYNLKPTKRLHDLLMVREGLAMIKGGELFLNYTAGQPYNLGLEGIYTKWGTKAKEGNIKCAIGWRD